MVIITLIAPRGAGKSTVGKDLAKRLNYKFIDLDEYMMKYLRKDGGIMGYAQKWGEKLNDATKGWHEYMKRLKEYIITVLIPSIENENIILDCGGGTTYSEFEEESRDIASFLKSKSTFVLIEAGKNDTEAINNIFPRELERRELARREEKVYALKDFTDGQLYDKVKTDYEFRIKGFRKQADIIVFNNKKVEDASIEIVLELKKRNLI